MIDALLSYDMMETMQDQLLTVNQLSISFGSERGRFLALEDVSFSLKAGQTLALVGESGCGKSITNLAIMGLLPMESARIESGQVLFHGQNLLSLSQNQLRGIRGNRIGMIFQEPMTALNPVYTVGQQLGEVFEIHQNLNRKAARRKAYEMLEKVNMPDPGQRMDDYPFQLSGGMRQRVVIAMALACKPDILIADEPTTALDVTIQAQILSLIKDLQKELNTAVIFITHDLGVVAEVADQVLVMYAGKVAEFGSVFDIFDHPHHPYTRALLKSIPTLSMSRTDHLPTIKGMVPGIFKRPLGCIFFDRCPYAQSVCQQKAPTMAATRGLSDSDKHQVACYFPVIDDRSDAQKKG